MGTNGRGACPPLVREWMDGRRVADSSCASASNELLRLMEVELHADEHRYHGEVRMRGTGGSIRAHSSGVCST